MVAHQEWSLVQQNIMAERSDLLDRLDFNDHKNLSIGIQFNTKTKAVSMDDIIAMREASRNSGDSGGSTTQQQGKSDEQTQSS